MKFETSFVARPVSWVRHLGNLLLIISAVLIFYIVFIYYQGVNKQAQLESLTRQQKKLAQHITQQQVQIHQALAHDELIQLNRDIDEINHISNFNSLDLASVLYVIELSIPGSVLLEHFSYDAGRAGSRLIAQSPEPDLLNEFVAKLQQDSRFIDVNLIDQKQLSNRQSVAFQYQIKIQHKIQ